MSVLRDTEIIFFNVNINLIGLCNNIWFIVIIIFRIIIITIINFFKRYLFIYFMYNFFRYICTKDTLSIKFLYK